MPSKLGRFCEGLIEAAWLAAVILTPVFFNIYSSRIFEPDKISLLRSLALVVLAAWIVRLVDENKLRLTSLRLGGLKKFLRKPLVWPVVFLIATTLLSNLLSVSPRISFLGSYQRLQGTYTFLSYIIFFAAMAVFIRQRQQIERLINVIILASFPVAFYGVMQRLQVDPIPWAGNTTARVASNLGNSIFVAAYLVMVFPLILARLVDTARALFKPESNFWLQLLRLTLYVLLAGLNLATIYFSGSRGPALGWMAGVYFFALLLALLWRRRWLSRLIIVLALAGSVFLVVFNLPAGPLTTLRKSPVVGRFGRLLDTESNTAKVRLYIWQGAVRLFLPHAPLEYPDGSKDALNLIRPLVGYGPESMLVVYSPFYSPKLGGVERRNASPDRAHNESWDALITTGLLGFAAYLAIFLTVFYFGLHWLGWVNTRLDKQLFALLALAGGLLGGIVLVAWGGMAYVGVGVPFGVALGLLVYLAVIGLRRGSDQAGPAIEPWRAILLTAFLAGVMAHFLEINFGIAIATTRLLFWSYAGMLLIIGRMTIASQQLDEIPPQPSVAKKDRLESPAGRGKRRKPSPSDPRQHQLRQQGWLISAGGNGFLTGILLVTLTYGFIVNPDRSSSMGEILSSAMTRLENTNSYWVLWMFLLTLMVSAVLFNLEFFSQKSLASFGKAYAVTTGVALGVAIPYALFLSGKLAVIVSSHLTSVSDLLAQLTRVNGLLNVFYIVQASLLLGLAYLLIDLTKHFNDPNPAPRSWLAAGLAAILCSALIVGSNLLPIHADMAYKLADPFSRNGQWEIVAEFYARAIRMAPEQDQYYLFQGKAYMELARVAQTPTEQNSLALRAEEYLKTAQRLNPLNTDHTANLARLQAWWASVASVSQIRLQHAQAASEYYSRALALSPNNPGLWGEWSSLYLEQLNQPQLAWQYLEKALALDDGYNVTQALAGNYFLVQANSSQDPDFSQKALDQALGYYRAAVDLSKGAQKARYLVYVSNVYIAMAEEFPVSTNEPPHYDAKRLSLSLAPLFDALQSDPTDVDRVSIQGQLARIYRELGDKPNALLYIGVALSNAEDSQRAYLEKLKEDINTMP